MGSDLQRNDVPLLRYRSILLDIWVGAYWGISGFVVMRMGLPEVRNG
ncbi:MAG: hypothetical protein J7641_22805 [Cyanobacteria bacterium SID2]|nr:hypothetical protein [Cyanobacteria bacterium SID2]MBP0003992.1 hypothetical protein [Cyanobacteria bacterium SBC]